MTLWGSVGVFLRPDGADSSGMTDAGAVADGNELESGTSRLERLRITIARFRAVPWLGQVTIAWCVTRVLIFALAWCGSWLATRHAFHYAEPSLFRIASERVVFGA